MDFDTILLKILDEFIEGGKPDIDKYCAEYPEYKDKLLAKLKTADFIKRNLQDEDLSGRKFGEYIILQELGRGGMGIVFLAVQPALSRLVVIKVLPPSFAHNEEALENFKKEAKIIAKFNHPNIIPVYSFGNGDGIYYIAMSYVTGLSLKTVIEKLTRVGRPGELKATKIRDIVQVAPHERQDITQQSITLKRNPAFWNKSYYNFVAAIGAEIAEAISYAHQNGIYHGDIKPSNIILTNEGIPMVVDFGLSRDIKKLSSSSKSTEFAGTLAYAAPEQIRKNIINEKTDIWALGVTLYESLALKKPFIDENIEKIADKIAKSEPIPLRSLNRKIPAELEAIALKCLEKKPENRYNGMSELSQDLNNYLELRPIKAKPISAVGRSIKWAKRHPVLTGFTGIFLCTALFSSALAYSTKINRLADLGIQLQHSHKFEEAERVFSEVLTLTKNAPFMTSSRVKALFGLAGLKNDQPEVALNYFRQCLSIDPKNIKSLNGIAFVYEEIGSYEEAIKYYRHVIMLSPRHSFAHLNLARLLYKQGRVDEAAKCYEDFLKIDPNNSIVTADYSRFLREIDRMEEVLHFWSKKCTKAQFIQDGIMRWEIISSLDSLIKKSQNADSPIDTYEEAKLFLIEKGFDNETSESILGEYNKIYPLSSRALLNYFRNNRPEITESQMKKASEDLVRQYKEKQKSQ